MFCQFICRTCCLIVKHSYSFCRLKPNIDFQYIVNAKGSSPAEILGTTYRTALKPALKALAKETKMIFISKHDESVDLQKQSEGIAKLMEEKKSHVSVLQAKDNEVSHLILYSTIYNNMKRNE